MKIGIDISQIVYQTGVSRYTAELVENLLKIDPDNDYVLFAGTLRQRSLIKSFVAKLPRKTRLVLTPLSPKLADIAFNRLNLPLDSWLGRVDVFHSSDWTIPNVKAPVVTTVHDLTFIKFPQEHLPYSIGVHQRHLNRAKDRAAAIIAVSQSTKNDLVDSGIPADKIRVVYEAAGKIFKPVKTDSVKKKYQLSKPFILSVGTIEPRKNLHRLIEAWQKLADRPELVIAGKFGWGEGVKPIKGVRLMGFVPDEDLAGFYSLAKAFVYPSLYEGFGLPVVEALSCGCPVVTSDRSSLPEVGGDAAVYVDPESVSSISKGIQAALSQTKKLKELGLEQAKKFSWEKTARETLSIYKEVYDHRH